MTEDIALVGLWPSRLLPFRDESSFIAPSDVREEGVPFCPEASLEGELTACLMEDDLSGLTADPLIELGEPCNHYTHQQKPETRSRRSAYFSGRYSRLKDLRHQKLPLSFAFLPFILHLTPFLLFATSGFGRLQ